MNTSLEVQDLTTTLDWHRTLLLRTADNLTEQQARRASTASTLTIASILKHAADTEEEWMDFAQRGADVFSQGDSEDNDWSGAGGDGADPRFAVADSETLEVLRERVQSVGARTTELLHQLDLDSAHALPEAPWFEAGASWSVRRVALHVLAEITQHAGHADIIRETIDGARTMA